MNKGLDVNSNMGKLLELHTLYMIVSLIFETETSV